MFINKRTHSTIHQLFLPLTLTHSEGSHGLDLSFVTHIYLMNAVMDASLEQPNIIGELNKSNMCINKKGYQ